MSQARKPGLDDAKNENSLSILELLNKECDGAIHWQQTDEGILTLKRTPSSSSSLFQQSDPLKKIRASNKLDPLLKERIIQSINTAKEDEYLSTGIKLYTLEKLNDLFILPKPTLDELKAYGNEFVRVIENINPELSKKLHDMKIINHASGTQVALVITDPLARRELADFLRKNCPDSFYQTGPAIAIQNKQKTLEKLQTLSQTKPPGGPAPL